MLIANSLAADASNEHKSSEYSRQNDKLSAFDVASELMHSSVLCARKHSMSRRDYTTHCFAHFATIVALPKRDISTVRHSSV